MFRKKVSSTKGVPPLEIKKEINKEIPEEIKEEPEKRVEAETPVKAVLKTGNPVKVLFVMDSQLVVVDSQERGITIPRSGKHKDVKIGDIIYL